MHSQRPNVVRSFLVVVSFFGWCAMAASASATYGDTTTFIGKVYDGDGGQATAALLDFPADVTSDANGNLYIADTFDHAIRKVDANGIISTLAGGRYGAADGTGSSAQFAQPRGVAVDAAGNVYVADAGNDAVRTITPQGAVATLVSSGLHAPYGVAVAGNTVFVLDTGNNALKAVSSSGGAVSTITTALNDPQKIAVTTDGSVAYVADNGSHRVLRVLIATGETTVVAGSGSSGYHEGVGSDAQFEGILGVALNASETTLYVADADLYLTDRIRTIDLATGATSLFALDTTQQQMIFPAGMTVRNESLYVAMSGLGVVRKYSIADAGTTTVVVGSDRFGSRDGDDPLFGRPSDLVLATDQRSLYVAENNRIRRVAIGTKSATTVIGSEVDNYRDGIPVGAGASNLDEARFSGVSGIVVNGAGTTLYVADRWNNRIRKIDLTTTPVHSSLVTGAGRVNSTGETSNGYQEGTKCTQVVDRNETLTLESGCAYFLQPTSVVLDLTEHFLYVADSGNNRIRKVRLSDGETTLVAGGDAGFADGVGADARFHTPWGMALSDDGNTLYVADRDNQRIRAVDLSSNTVRTLAGAGSAGYREGIGTSAYFSLPRSIKLGADQKLYLTEVGSQRIRQLDPTTGLTKLVAGSGMRGYVDGAQSIASFNNLGGLAPETGSDKLYVADSSNDILRLVDIKGVAPYTNPAPTVTAVRPGEIDKDWDKGSGLKVKVLGTGFRYGAEVKLFTHSAKKTYVLSSKEIVIDLPLTKLSAGWYDVTVTNVDGQTATLEAGLAVRAADDSVPDVFYSTPASQGITAYSSQLRGGFMVTAGNVWGDERAEIIAGTGNGLSPQVRIFSNTGVLRGQFFAYSKTTRTGVRVAACDLNGDGIDEIVTVPGKGTRPLVKVFNGSGKQILTKGFTVLNGKFTGGVNLVCGDIDGNSRAEIIVAAAQGGGPQVAIYLSNGKKTGQFLAAATTFRGGTAVGTTDVNGDGIREILTAPESGIGRVNVLNNKGKKIIAGFFPFDKKYAGGLNVAGGDTNDDGKDEIVVAPRSNAQARVKVYSPNGKKILGSFFAYPRGFTGGVIVSVADVNGDGIQDILTAPASNFKPSFRMFSQGGKSL
ncbi:MAG: FG-GAP-like repeat-containing protein [bacterium]